LPRWPRSAVRHLAEFAEVLFEPAHVENIDNFDRHDRLGSAIFGNYRKTGENTDGFSQCTAGNKLAFRIPFESLEGRQSMKSSNSACGRVMSVLSVMVVAGLLSGLLSSRATAASPEAPASTEPAPPAPAIAKLSPEETASRGAWRAAILKAPRPKTGCFKAEYPNTEWQQVQCVTPPQHPSSPATGRRPQIVGNGNDFSAQTSGIISKATGYFQSDTSTLSENGGSNSFGLQLNTNPFMTSACKNAAVPSQCQGWQQFIFGNPMCGTSGNIPCVFMQYWLLNYGPTCPTPSPSGTQGWASKEGNDCYLNLSSATPVPAQTIADLDQLTLIGEAAGPLTSDTDSVILSTAAGSPLYMLSFTDSLLNLAQSQWQDAEFNILAACCLGQVNFNNGSTIVVVHRRRDHERRLLRADRLHGRDEQPHPGEPLLSPRRDAPRDQRDVARNHVHGEQRRSDVFMRVSDIQRLEPVRSVLRILTMPEQGVLPQPPRRNLEWVCLCSDPSTHLRPARQYKTFAHLLLMIAAMTACV
jgi:hypothetical protein